MKIKKQIIISIFSVFLIISCQSEEKPIKTCNLEINQGIAKVDGKIYTGSCNLWYYTDDKDSILLKNLTYKKGRLYKEIAYYTDNGGIEYIGFRDKDGNIDGEFERYFRNGQLELKGVLKDGYRTGEWQIYNDKGDLIEEVEYDNKGNPITKN